MTLIMILNSPAGLKTVFEVDSKAMISVHAHELTGI